MGFSSSFQLSEESFLIYARRSRDSLLVIRYLWLVTRDSWLVSNTNESNYFDLISANWITFSISHITLDVVESLICHAKFISAPRKHQTESRKLTYIVMWSAGSHVLRITINDLRFTKPLPSRKEESTYFTSMLLKNTDSRPKPHHKP